VNLQNIKKEALFIQQIMLVLQVSNFFLIFVYMLMLYASTLSIVAKQKVLLFTVHITRNKMQNPIINNYVSLYWVSASCCACNM
jgi:hypothetical protein